MEPRPRGLDRETRQPLVVELSPVHLNNLQKYIDQANKFLEATKPLIVKGVRQSGFTGDLNTLRKKAEYNQKSFKNAIVFLTGGGAIEIKRIKIGKQWGTSVGRVWGDEFYIDFMHGLFDQGVGISQKGNQIGAALKTRNVVLRSISPKNSNSGK